MRIQTIRDAGDLIQFDVAFRTKAGSNKVPTRVRYRVLCDTTGTVPLDWTDHAELAADTTIELRRPATEIITAANSIETKRLVLYADFIDASAPEVAQHVFVIRNTGTLPAYS